MLKHRADCARLVAAGSVRINRQPTDKPHARLRVGDTVTLPLRADVRVLTVRSLAARRGPSAEARALYDEIDAPCGGVTSAAYPGPSDPPAANPESA